MTFSTPDINFAAFLMARGEPLAGTEREGKRVLFCFEFPDQSEFEEHQMSFYSGAGHVSGLAITNAAKALKNLIHVV